MKRLITILAIVFIFILLFSGAFFLLGGNKEEELSSTLGPQEEQALPLTIALEGTREKRKEIIREIRERGTFDLRDIYEKHLAVVGANGLIASIEEAYPGCHDRGHDLGKVIYAELNSIGESLRVCNDSCYSGCMHGVLMEAFTEETSPPHEHTEDELEFHLHVTVDEVKKKMETICSNEDITSSYAEGDCIHGIGHALMYMSNYTIKDALSYCSLFDTEVKEYYCATGAYMEYNANFHYRDSETNSEFYPCDTYAHPAACFRYKLVYVSDDYYRNDKPTIDLINRCLEEEGLTRLGCFHGLGNAHMDHIVNENVELSLLCSFGNKDDQYMCIEGAIERMARYKPDAAKRACNQLTGWQFNHCEQGRVNELYSLTKAFDLYFDETS